MSQELKKRVKDNTVIYENDEARWAFSKGSPPHIDDYVVAITAIDKKVNIPIMIHFSGREWRRMLLDMGIKTPDPRI